MNGPAIGTGVSGSMGPGQFTDTQLRFLSAVSERVPLERVREVYLFAPMRQGGVETGIAVLAAQAEPTVEPEVGTEAVAAASQLPSDRYTVFTASYRLQLKGPDRGRWEMDVVEEADAPLTTVDAVVRGVHRRSGEPHDVERVSQAELASALQRSGTAWTTAS